MASDNQKIANQIKARLSLRTPQQESLQILCDVLGQLSLSKSPDLRSWLEIIHASYPSVKAFEREFPSLCFALATGVGKTRLMGAMIAWLYLTGRSRHFFVLAPNLTIYEKLKQDFLMGSPKYVFQGIPELVQTPPVIITGDDYEDGRGVRLDYAISETMTGDLFAGEESVHINIFNISKINAKDNKKGAKKSKDPKMRRLQEYIGDSYFNYLAELPDLVVFMDEAHRYYASAGAKALNDLNPVLGIELTATPKTTGAKPREFNNIIYHYPLASALNDGYVKMPAVATRKEFVASEYTKERLEQIKLEDGIHHHEYVKAELTSYANNNGTPLVKPFMLVVAQDTIHAEQLKKQIEDPAFFQGSYAGKVITVHSNLGGEESEETMQRLLEVESDQNTEIVIHVNKLKEGWDVTNLYTIVPLRASASEILTEQTIGRGLRLPYGKRTGAESVDRLTIIAHDRFQDIIDQANDAESIIKKTLFIGSDDEDGIPEKAPSQIYSPSVADIAMGMSATMHRANEVTELKGVYNLSNQDSSQSTEHSEEKSAELQQAERKIADLTVAIVHEESKRLTSSQQLKNNKVKEELFKKVKSASKVLFSPDSAGTALPDSTAQQSDMMPGVSAQQLTEPQNTTLPLLGSDDIKNIVDTVTDVIAEYTIDIPQITILPDREVNYTFDDFDLSDLDRIALKPGSKSLLLRNLENETSSTISWEVGVASEARLEDYLVRVLVDQDEIDYDEHASLLYKLSGQMVKHLESYLNKDDIEGLLKTASKTLAEFIWSQMKKNMVTTPTDYYGKLTKGFEVLRPATFNFSSSESPRHFDSPVASGEKNKIRQMIFTGFKKCCYPFQKFDSVDGELRLAQVLEHDSHVKKWMKPGSGQFRIEYRNGKNYEPDFVVETETEFLLMEPKKATEITSPDVQAKAKSATRWCEYANQHAKEHKVKKWRYSLIPHDAITASMSATGLADKFEFV